MGGKVDELLIIGWAAGIVDGEGTISLSVGKYPFIRVTMTCPLAPQALMDFFAMGGTSHWTLPSGKTAYAWYANGGEALAVLFTIRPFLVTKRADADRVISTSRAVRAGVIVKDPKMLYRIHSAWAAGIIDGEGTIGLEARTGHKHRPSVDVRMSHLETVRSLRYHFNIGQVNPARRVAPAHYLPQLRWRAVSGDAMCVLKEVLPHLVTKQARARLVLDASHLHGYG
jgi:hypothetical protein